MNRSAHEEQADVTDETATITLTREQCQTLMIALGRATSVLLAHGDQAGFESVLDLVSAIRAQWPQPGWFTKQ